MPIKSPSGIDHKDIDIEDKPRPPIAVRLRRSIAIGGLIFCAVLAATIFYGVTTRHVSASTSGARTASGRRTTPAGEVADQVLARRDAQQQEQERQFALSSRPGMQPLVASDQLIAPAKLLSTPGARVQLAQAQPAPPMNVTATPEQRQLAAAYEAEQTAMAAPASASTWTAPERTNARATAGQGPDGEQDAKERFLEKGHGEKDKMYLDARRIPLVTPYQITAGWKIFATLDSMLNADLPGEATAIVSQNVYDSATGRWLLIPQGSRLFGAYNSHVGYAQSAVQTIWYRVIFPDGSTLNLEGMTGYDAQGRSGLRDKVDNHYKRLIAFSVLTSGFYAAGILAQSRGNNSVLAYPSPAQTASSAAATNMSQEFTEVTRRNLNIQPTILIRPGDPFLIKVNRDIVFDAPYRPMTP